MRFSLLEPLEPRQLLSTTISVNTGTTYQTIRAMGGSVAKNARWGGAPVSDDNTVYDLSHLIPSTVRVAINLAAWEPTPVNVDTNSVSSINWSDFKDTSSTHAEFKQLQTFQKDGMLIVASIFDGPNWLVEDPQDKQHRTVDPSKYNLMAEGIATWLLRAKETYGVNITNVSINESNAGYNLRFSKYIFEDFVTIAGPMFAKMGLGNVKWDIGDDGFVNPDIFVTPVLQDKAIAPYLGPIAWHSWNLDNYSDSSFNALVSIAKQYGKEIWATELGYDPLLQFNDPQQFTTFSNAIQDAEIYLRSLTVVHCTVMDYWDFADDFPLVSPTGQPYPDYYIVKSYQDNLKPGAQIVKASSSDSSILSIAAKDTNNNHFFAQAIDEHTSGTQTVTFTGLPDQPLTLTRSDSSHNATVIGTYTPSGGKLTLTLPANSVSTLSGKYPASSSGSGSSGGTSIGSSSGSKTITLKPVADAYAQDGSAANTNFGKSQQLLVKTSSSAGYTRRTYLQFNLSSLSTINSATLQLFGELSSTSMPSLTVDVLDVSRQTWTESSLDWDNKPGYTPGNIAMFKVTGTTGKYYSIDLTSYLQARKKAGATLITLALVSATTNGPAIILDSRESANPPKLVVT